MKRRHDNRNRSCNGNRSGSRSGSSSGRSRSCIRRKINNDDAADDDDGNASVILIITVVAIMMSVMTTTMLIIPVSVKSSLIRHTRSPAPPNVNVHGHANTECNRPVKLIVALEMGNIIILETVCWLKQQNRTRAT